jgi:hypothetical protein
MALAELESSHPIIGQQGGTPMTPTPSEFDQPTRPEPVYEPPALVEVGSFTDLTRGKGGGPGDDPYLYKGYWLI